MRKRIKNILIDTELEDVALSNRLSELYPKFQINHKKATIDNTIMITFFCDSGTESHTFNLTEIKKEITIFVKTKHILWKT